jgi:hypothetical protein
MKKNYFLCLAFCLITGVTGLFAQREADSTKYLLSDENIFTGFGGPFVEFSSVNQEFAVSLGAGAALLIDQKVYIGGYFEGIATNHYMGAGRETPRISLEHGGIWMGYVYKPQKAIHGGFSLKLGWGEIDLSGNGLDNALYENNDYRDRIFAIIPQAEVEFNMTRWFKINVGVGYRIVAGIDATYMDMEEQVVDFYNKGDYNSPVGTVTFIFGGKEKK